MKEIQKFSEYVLIVLFALIVAKNHTHADIILCFIVASAATRFACQLCLLNDQPPNTKK